MQQANKTARRFTFTSYVNTDVITGDRSHIKYAIWQREVCPTTQREHWQGYIHVKTPCRYSKIQEILGDPVAHVEIAGGTPEQNHTYCTKADSRKPGTQPIEIGTLAATGQGKRNDLQVVVEKVKDGASIEELAEEHGVEIIKYHKGIEKLIDLNRSGRDANTAPEILIYWGDSGTGKTRKATEDNPGAYILSKPNADKQVWWDGYQGEETVIFDEFYGWIPYDTLLRVCDRYPLRVPYKGGHYKLKATRIIFTSNKPWEDWYPNIDDKSALQRRIREFGTITHFRQLAQRDVN